MCDEVWKPVVGWEAEYAVSNKGRVKSVRRSTNTKPGMIIRQRGAGGRKKRYAAVTLYRANSGAPERKTAYVHRLVLEAFCGVDPERSEVNHKDGDRRNNNLNNLEWVTRAENIRHCMNVLGTHSPPPPNTMRGEESPVSKLTTDDVRTIRRLYESGAASMAQLTKQYPVCRAQIGRIIRRERWAHVA